MKVVYGNPKTIMTIGMAMLGDTPTPFFGFVDRASVEGDAFFTEGPNSTSLIDKIDALGGVIIYLENPEAAERMHAFMAQLFDSASNSDWRNVEQAEATLQ